MEHFHNMKAVCVRTGLSAHLIRIWEKRYGAVEPARTDSQRRLYSDQDVHRLKLLHMLTQQGFGISQIARLSEEQLVEMVRAKDALDDPKPKNIISVQPDPDWEQVQLNACLSAIREFDGAKLEALLEKAMVQIGASGVLERLLIRLLQRIGEEWANGWLTAGQEHFASAGIRDYLGRQVRSMALSDSAPCIVVGTPEGQLHELGAVIASAIARKSGWRVIYVGASLPAEELAGAMNSNQARALVLSIIYPIDDPQLSTQLLRLRRMLPTQPILVGGSQLQHYADALKRMNAIVVSDMQEFTEALLKIREEIPRTGAMAG
jgi:MerR family transcriptional regulator, light-induced transcriptional regulator